AMGYGHGRREKDQAAGRLNGVHAPAQGLPGHDEMIESRRVAAQRKLESALAGKGSVACTRVAADFGQERDDLVAKTRSGEFFRFGYPDVGRYPFPIQARGDDRLAVADSFHGP